MSRPMQLLCPEWQCCRSARVHAGALWLAESLFRSDDEYLHIDAPFEETLVVKDGVHGLDSIATRFLQTRQELARYKPTHLRMIGGTCGAEAAPISYFNELHEGRLGIVWFDAHGDLNTPGTSPSGDFHGMVLRTLLGEGPEIYCAEMRRPLCAAQVFLVGTRDLDVAESDYIGEKNIHIIPDLDANSSLDLKEKITKAGYAKIYIHIDVDVLNPDSFSDALMPTIGGPTVEELTACITLLTAAFDVVGLSVVEYCGRSEESRNQLMPIFAKAI